MFQKAVLSVAFPGAFLSMVDLEPIANQFENPALGQSKHNPLPDDLEGPLHFLDV